MLLFWAHNQAPLGKMVQNGIKNKNDNFGMFWKNCLLSLPSQWMIVHLIESRNHVITCLDPERNCLAVIDNRESNGHKVTVLFPTLDENHTSRPQSQSLILDPEAIT